MCIGKLLLLLIFFHCRMRACSFRILERTIFLSTRSQFNFQINFNVPSMILIAELSWVYCLLKCVLFIDTKVQYSAAEYTNASILIRREFASAPHDVPLNLAIILCRVLIFSDNLARWFLNLSVLFMLHPDNYHRSYFSLADLQTAIVSLGLFCF